MTSKYITDTKNLNSNIPPCQAELVQKDVCGYPDNKNWEENSETINSRSKIISQNKIHNRAVFRRYLGSSLCCRFCLLYYFNLN